MIFAPVGTFKNYTKEIHACCHCPECKWASDYRYKCNMIDRYVTQAVNNNRIDGRCELLSNRSLKEIK